MKTRPPRSQRKKRPPSSPRPRSPAARIPPPLPAPQASPALPSSEKELPRVKAEVADGSINLIRSTVTDAEGSYLVMSIEVPVPFTVAYEAWTRFEEVPHFMRGIHSRSQNGSRMTWCPRTLFHQFIWQARVCEQRPFDLISWKSVTGTPHPGFGAVAFEPITHLRTWVLVQVAFDMTGIHRGFGDPIPSISRALEQSLKRFHHSLTLSPAASEQPQTPRPAQLLP